MQLFYENQGNNTYLVYEIREEDELDTMSLGMLTNNTIPGFVPTTFTQMDTTRYIKYNVSSKLSVAQLFTGAVNKKRLVGVFTGIVEAMLSAEDYMLDPDSMLLEQEYIFADVSTCETEVVCLPVMNAERKHTDLGAFFKNIIFNTQFDQTENCDHVAQILNYLNSTPILSLGDFKALLEQISKPAPVAQPVAAQPVAQPVAAQPVPPQPVARPVAPQPVAAQPVVQQPAARPVAAQPVTPPPVAKPVAPKPVQPPVTQTAPAQSNGPKEKEMSMFYLLQHYNKENAAIYKAQQEAKKNKKGAAAASAPVAPAPAPKKGSQPAAAFAIPGKQPAAAFAIPGQAEAPAAKPVQPAVPQPAPKPVAAKPVAPQPVAPQPVLQPSMPVDRPPVPQPSTPISFGETTVLSAGIGETTVLGTVTATVQNDPHLIRVKNNEKIPLNKPVFRIGKERSFVDYFIGDNTAISRSHANIVSRDGEYFVVDTNSTNHTYVNGGMINSNVEVKLSHGAKIRLGNEDFEFKMY